MSVAAAIIDYEPERLDWFTVTDTDGRPHRYASRPGLWIPFDAPIVGQWSPGRPPVLGAIAGRPVLNQEAPGLPDLVIVAHVAPAGSGTAHWLGGYEQVEAEEGTR
ncbi:unnamed protein product [Gemmataceae bacterium]|nr:unnamed protein product [Gemmataceae bacterium]VTU02438.1 unnamed protein product [Gemmataceae bacterium]